MTNLIKLTEQKSLPITLIKKVEKAEILLKCGPEFLATYRTQIKLVESIGDGMAFLVGENIGIEKRIIFTIIEKLLAALSLSLNVGKNLEPHQLDALAKKIYAKYYYLSFDEIMYVFDQGTTGKYGKLYDRIDEEVIFSWLEKYDTDERIQIANKKNSDEMEVLKQEKIEEDLLIAKHLVSFSTELIKEVEQKKKKEEDYKLYRDKYFTSKPKEDNERDNN